MDIQWYAAAQELTAQMTLEEKASLCSGKDFWNLKGIERLNLPEIMVTDGPHGLRKQSEETDHEGLRPSIPSTCFPRPSPWPARGTPGSSKPWTPWPGEQGRGRISSLGTRGKHR